MMCRCVCLFEYFLYSHTCGYADENTAGKYKCEIDTKNNPIIFYH